MVLNDIEKPCSPVSTLAFNSSKLSLAVFFAAWAIFVKEHLGAGGSFGFLKDSKRLAFIVKSTGAQRLVVPKAVVKPLFVANSSMNCPVVASAKSRRYFFLKGLTRD